MTVEARRASLIRYKNRLKIKQMLEYLVSESQTTLKPLHRRFDRFADNYYRFVQPEIRRKQW